MQWLEHSTLQKEFTQSYIIEQILRQLITKNRRDEKVIINKKIKSDVQRKRWYIIK